MIPSEEYDERIERELDNALCVIVVWSRESIKSKWVRAEASAADDQGKLIPVAFDSGVTPPIRFRQLNMAKVSSPSLEPLTDAVKSLLTELAATTGKFPEGWAGGDQKPARAGGRSGARMVTAGRWLLTARLLGKAVFDLDLLPSGIMTGKGSWLISRVQLSGRWTYDSSRQMLQLEVSGGLAQGVQSMIIQITSWDDEDTAACTWDGRRAQLKRASG